MVPTKFEHRRRTMALVAAGLLVACVAASGQSHEPIERAGVTGEAFEDAPEVGERVEYTEEEWRSRLTEDAYRILRQAGTERPHSGEYSDHHAAGLYRCGGCGAPLYDAADKFESGTGWPSFTEPVAEGRVAERVDTSHGMRRVEIVCAACDGHLGHVFEDGPPPTGRRHCVNSLSLQFEPNEDVQ